MKTLKKGNEFLAISYLVVCLMQVLILPREYFSFLDNVLFVFGISYVLLDSLSNKESRILLLAFSGLFFWSFVSEYFSVHENSWLANLSYQLFIIKLVCVLLITKITIEKMENPSVFCRIIDVSFILLVCINLIIAYNPMGFGISLQHLYTSSDYGDFIYYYEPGAFRLAGTQLNPNDNGIIWACFIVYYFQSLKEKWVFVLLAIGLVLLTQSRTNVLVLLICFSLYFFKLFISKDGVKRLLYFGLPILAGLVVIIWKSRYLKLLFTGEAFSSSSFLTRVGNYAYLSTYNGWELLMGKGVIISPEEFMGVAIDSEYLMLIFQFGIIGLVFWLINLAVLIKLNKDKNPLLYLLILLVIINSLTNFTLLNLQIGVVIAFFFGLSLSYKRFIK